MMRPPLLQIVGMTVVFCDILLVGICPGHGFVNCISFFLFRFYSNFFFFFCVSHKARRAL